jgi:hypothetical protein
MNIKLAAKYWLANKETKFNLLFEKKYTNNCFEKEKERLNYKFPIKTKKELDSYKLRLNEIEFKYNKKDEYVALRNLKSNFNN